MQRHVARSALARYGVAVASVALASGIIDDRLFTALVLTSLLTSLAAGLFGSVFIAVLTSSWASCRGTRIAW